MNTNLSKKIFKNGICLIAAPLQNIQSVAIVIGIKSGLIYENKDEAGISHFIEHMLLKGTKKWSSPIQVSQAIDSIPGEFSADTFKEMTQFYFWIPKKSFKSALIFLKEILSNSLFNATEIKKERKVILEEIASNQEDAWTNIDDLLEECLYAKNIFSANILGNKNSINNLTRKKIINYFENRYQGKNIFVGLVGNINQKDINLAKKTFSELKPKGSGIKSQQPPAIDVNDTGCIKAEFRKTDQITLGIAFPGIGYLHPKHYLQRLLALILGENMSSRLYNSLRIEKNYVYDITTFSIDYLNSGYLAIKTGFNYKNLEAVLSLIKKEIEKIIKNSITKEELDRNKDFLIGNLKLYLESPLNVAEYLVEEMLKRGKIIDKKELLKEINGFSLKDMNKYCKEILQLPKMCVAIIGKIRESKLEKILKKGR